MDLPRLTDILSLVVLSSSLEGEGAPPQLHQLVDHLGKLEISLFSNLSCSQKADKDPKKGSSTADSSSKFGQQRLSINAESCMSHIDCSIKDEV